MKEIGIVVIKSSGSSLNLQNDVAHMICTFENTAWWVCMWGGGVVRSHTSVWLSIIVATLITFFIFPAGTNLLPGRQCNSDCRVAVNPACLQLYQTATLHCMCTSQRRGRGGKSTRLYLIVSQWISDTDKNNQPSRSYALPLQDLNGWNKGWTTLSVYLHTAPTPLAHRLLQISDVFS